MGVNEIANEVAANEISKAFNTQNPIIIIIIIGIVVQIIIFAVTEILSHLRHRSIFIFNKEKNRIEKKMEIYDKIYQNIVKLRQLFADKILSNQPVDQNILQMIKDIRLEKLIRGIYFTCTFDNLLNNILDYYSSILVDIHQKDDKKELDYLESFKKEFNKID